MAEEMWCTVESDPGNEQQKNLNNYKIYKLIKL